MCRIAPAAPNAPNAPAAPRVTTQWCELVKYAQSEAVADQYVESNLCTDSAVLAAREALPAIPVADVAARARLLKLFAQLVQRAGGRDHLFHEQWVQGCWLFDVAHTRLVASGKEPPLAAFATAVFSLSEKVQHCQGADIEAVYAWIHRALHRGNGKKQEPAGGRQEAVHEMEVDILEALRYDIPAANPYALMGMIFLRIGILSRGAHEAKLESAWQVAGHLLFNLLFVTSADFELVLGAVGVGLLESGLLAPCDVGMRVPECAHFLAAKRAGASNTLLRDCLLIAALSSNRSVQQAVRRTSEVMQLEPPLGPA
jgi:hypothetical protein